MSARTSTAVAESSSACAACENTSFTITGHNSSHRCRAASCIRFFLKSTARTCSGPICATHPPASAVPQFIDAVNTPPNGDMYDPPGGSACQSTPTSTAGSTVPTGTDTLSSARINAGGRNGSPRSSRQWLQAMFVMQSRQDRGRDHVVTSRDLMSVWPREPAWQRVGEIRAEARMWSATH